jgi:hypothetical protein
MFTPQFSLGVDLGYGFLLLMAKVMEGFIINQRRLIILGLAKLI